MHKGCRSPKYSEEKLERIKEKGQAYLEGFEGEFKKDVEQGILFDGLTKLNNSNTENITKFINLNTVNITLMITTKKSEASSTPVSTDACTKRVSKLTKPAKVPSWTKDMFLETYTNQLTTWTGINEDVPEYVKYHDLIEELKKNEEIKGLQGYVADHILPVLIKKTDQTVDKVVELLDRKYGRSRTEKVKEVIEDLFKFREDQYKDDDELMLAMRVTSETSRIEDDI